MQNNQVIQLPHPDVSTGTQIDTLLRILSTLTMLMINPERERETIPGASVAPGNLRDSAEATYINACNRLDGIIADSARWTTEFQKASAAKFDEIQAAQMKWFAAQEESARALQSPHNRFLPTLQLSDDQKNWVAFVGDPTTPHVIMGIGRSPEEAMLNFDEIFKGRVPLYMMQWLMAKETAHKLGIAPPPVPNPTFKHNEKQPVDRQRNKSTPRASRTRKKDGGDREDSAPPVGGS